jgi:lipopolysaccharide export system ATP-binding protein
MNHTVENSTESTERPDHAQRRHEGLTVTGLGKSYRRRPVVRDVSLELHRGEAVGLLGPNGAGKTTCFYMIIGLVPADAGTISIDGIDLTPLPMYRRARLGLGYLPQEASIFRGLSVEDNIRAVLELVEPDRVTRANRLDELLGEFSITHLAASGGASRLPAAWPRTRPSSCWTSRSPGSTRSPSTTSGCWSGTSRNAASAC